MSHDPMRQPGTPEGRWDAANKTAKDQPGLAEQLRKLMFADWCLIQDDVCAVVEAAKWMRNSTGDEWRIASGTFDEEWERLADRLSEEGDKP